MIFNLLKNKGLAKGERAREWLEEKIKSKTGIENLTFLGLKNL